MAKAPVVIVNASRMDSLDVICLIAICARFLSDWDYSLGVHHFPTWVGPKGEAEAMTDREVRMVRLILKQLGG
jgi:hypothetical protein